MELLVPGSAASGIPPESGGAAVAVSLQETLYGDRIRPRGVRVSRGSAGC
jgi:hypothetical protein